MGARDAMPDSGGAGGGSSLAQATQRAASIPVGIENVNNSPLLATDQRALLRFVPDGALRIDRLYFGFNVSGAVCEPGAEGDGQGDGGLIHATLVNIDATTGLPGTPIDQETVGACARYAEARAEVSSKPVLVWMNVDATLTGGRMYGLLLANAHADPAGNFFSLHMPLVDAALAGPQARNELDANAGGAVMSLDPREHVAWSTDAGETWLYGVDNGQYPSFIGSPALSHPATRVPQYGFRRSDGGTLAPQPYYAYSTACTSCSVLYANARYARSFSELGGFTAAATDVGALTIVNTGTGVVSSCTPEPGYGFRTCILQSPVPVAVGESYVIESTGSVELMHMDNAQRVMFPSVGTSEGELRAFQTQPAPGTNAKDVPSLWAGPVSANFPVDGEERRN